MAKRGSVEIRQFQPRLPGITPKVVRNYFNHDIGQLIELIEENGNFYKRVSILSEDGSRYKPDPTVNR